MPPPPELIQGKLSTIVFKSKMSDNYMRSNREKSNIDIAILEIIFHSKKGKSC